MQEALHDVCFYPNFPGIDQEKRMHNLKCQMSLMAADIKNMTALIRNFASCKACIKKLNKATPEPEKLSPVLTQVVKAAPDPVISLYDPCTNCAHLTSAQKNCQTMQ